MSDIRIHDEAAVQGALAEVYQAWEANDANAFVARYTDDATAILPGSLRLGREAIREHMARGFEGPLKGSSTYNQQLSTRFLGDDVAVVVSESGIKFAGETQVPQARKIYATWVLEKHGGEWWIAAYHNSPVSASAH